MVSSKCWRLSSSFIACFCFRFRDNRYSLSESDESGDVVAQGADLYDAVSISVDEATMRIRGIEDRYTHSDIIRIAAVMSPLWFGANCLYNYSLLQTSVGSSTIIRLSQ